MVADTKKKFECLFFEEAVAKYKNIPLPLTEGQLTPRQI